MAKYRVLSLLWDDVNHKYIYPGAMVELEGTGAEILLKRGRIEPFTQLQIENESEDLDNGTND